MKVLVAATCIALLAAVGYYFFSEYKKAKDLESYREEAKIRSMCQNGDLLSMSSWKDLCREKGYIK